MLNRNKLSKYDIKGSSLTYELSRKHINSDKFIFFLNLTDVKIIAN